MVSRLPAGTAPERVVRPLRTARCCRPASRPRGRRAAGPASARAAGPLAATADRRRGQRGGGGDDGARSSHGAPCHHGVCASAEMKVAGVLKQYGGNRQALQRQGTAHDTEDTHRLPFSDTLRPLRRFDARLNRLRVRARSALGWNACPLPATRSLTWPGCPGSRSATKSSTTLPRSSTRSSRRSRRCRRSPRTASRRPRRRPASTTCYRDDEPVPCLTPEQALRGAPAVELQRFKVPRILVEE